MRGFAVVLACAVAGCSHTPYVCTDDAQCVDGEALGRCEPQGFCSFPDTECPSGQRFEADAGDDLGGTCVPEINLACGAVDTACCDDGSCVGNAFCDGGTCKQCVIEVANGASHACFRRYDNTIWCSGSNEDGQLGNGSISSAPVTPPVQVRDATNVAITDAIALGLGGITSCAIRADHTVWCWGHGEVCDVGAGQLGNGDVESSDVAQQVIRASDGQPLTDIVEVYGSFCHTCARDMAGGVWCWGSNFSGQLGDGTTTSTDAAVPVLTAMAGPPLTGADSLTIGFDHACVHTTAGDVFCWGQNDNGQLSQSPAADHPIPTQVNVAATSVVAGGTHTCAIQSDRTVVCWGDNDDGQLGIGDNNDLEVDPVGVLTELGGTRLPDVEELTGGAETSCVRTTAGTVFCWGEGNVGENGNAGGNLPAPVLDLEGKPLVGVAKLVARFEQACAFLVTGELVCWGRNSFGELGDGTLVNHGLAAPGMGPTCP